MVRRLLPMVQILWPAFVVAGILEMLVFASFDPSDLSLGAWQPERLTTYSLTFFLFWALAATSSGVSHWLMSQGAPALRPRLSRN